MTDCSLKFSITLGKSACRVEEKEICRISYDDKLTVKLWYEFSTDPLTLSANAYLGDLAELIVRPHRIELYINGTLCDEEWPYGRSLIGTDSVWDGVIIPEISEIPPENRAQVSFYTRRNITTDEIRIGGVNIGDCIPYSDEEDTDGLYHLFYLYDRHHHRSKWHFGAHQWAHLSTADFKSWDEHPMAVGITEDWEGSICTGSVCRAEDEQGNYVWYAWYAVRMCDRSPARITYARSRDMVHFEKCGEFFRLPEGYEPTSARDPMVFYDNGLYHMYVTTSRLSDGSGCLAHLVNEHMSIRGWRDAGVAVAWIEHCDQDDPTRFWQPECPDRFVMGDYCYLVFGIGGRGRYCYRRICDEDWIFPENNLIPCGNVPKSASLPGTGRRVFMGFSEENGYAGSLCAVEAFKNPDGTLCFEALAL